MIVLAIHARRTCALIAAGSLLIAAAFQTSHFDLAKPDRVYELPSELLEVSALTDVDEHTVACVQDEAAMLYLYDLREGRVVKRLAFGPPGDMEGLTRVGDVYHAIRSDGMLYRFSIEGSGVRVRDSILLSLPMGNIEGLGYDEARDRVLVSPKEIQKGEKELRDRRAIYAYDPRTRKLDPEPALELTVSDVISQARTAGWPIPMRTTDKGRQVPALKLRFSSVAVEPGTDRIYLLSAVDRTLLIVDRLGRLLALHQLDAKLYPKPEGITFLPSGAVLISNEGKSSAPNLLLFKRSR